MTQSSTRFISYRSCPSNKKIALEDGAFITVPAKGDIMINQNKILKDFLLVLKLFSSLIFVHKLITDFHDLVFFSPTTSQFQDSNREDDWI